MTTCRPEVDGQLDERLNELLVSIGIPITLQSPFDLTPTLLIAMLESLLRERLPLSDEARRCRTRAGRIEAMKWFLGVLGDDILGRELGSVDPRMLAEGGEVEVRIAAEALLLAWDSGLFDKDTTLPLSHASTVAGDPIGQEDLEEDNDNDSEEQTTGSVVTENRTVGQTTAVSQSNISTASQQVRYDGWIQVVDEEETVAERVIGVSTTSSWSGSDEAESEELAELEEANLEVARLLEERAGALEALMPMVGP
jgi:hypothetical protein